MNIQTFLVEETKNLVFESDKKEEWQKQVEDLGLEGQRKLQKGDNSPIPFEYMNRKMKHILKAICESSQHVEQYDKTPIPLEVLSLVALAKQEGYFDRMEVWFDEKDPDPVLIGVKKDKEHTWIENLYLMARWGAEKVSFEYLEAEAAKRIKNKLIAKAKEQIKTYQGILEDPDQAALNELNDISSFI